MNKSYNYAAGVSYKNLKRPGKPGEKIRFFGSEKNAKSTEGIEPFIKWLGNNRISFNNTTISTDNGVLSVDTTKKDKQDDTNIFDNIPAWVKFAIPGAILLWLLK